MRTSTWATSIVVLLCMLQTPVLHATDLQSPVGLWKTIDDKTGAARAIVRIYLQEKKYHARIEQSFKPGANTRVCSVCTDDRKNQPIIGLEIIRGMTPRDDEYVGGEILDPESGRVYRCKFRLEEGGRKLVVRGYLGISILGRSQTWVREP
jgi:uncharacterized protein (DUF2147 family)